MAVILTATLLVAASFAEPVLKPGWPVGPFPEDNWWAGNRGISLADIDSDGTTEVVVAIQAGHYFIGDGSLHVFRYDGTEYPGWPRILPGYTVGSPSIGDIDSDGHPDIAATSQRYNDRSVVQAWNSNGQPLQGFPVEIPGLRADGSALADLDLDGDLEIMVDVSAFDRSVPAQIRVYDENGVQFSGWPFVFPSGFTAGAFNSPAVGEFDGDPFPELVNACDSMMTVLNHDGTIVPGWPVYTSNRRGFWTCEQVIGDIDIDGWPEVITDAIAYDSGLDIVWVIEHDGVVKPGWPVAINDYTTETFAVSNFDASTSTLEILFIGTDGMHVMNVDGGRVSGWPFKPDSIGPKSHTQPICADLDNDGDVDWLRGGNQIWPHFKEPSAFDVSHNVAGGFPIPLQYGVADYSAGAVGDLEGDGVLDLVFHYHPTDSAWPPPDTGWNFIYAYDLGIPVTVDVEWPQNSHDQYKTGNYDGPCWTDVPGVDTPPLPDRFAVNVRPNPFNSSTQVRLVVPRSGHVRVDAFDVLGRRAAILLDEERAAGEQLVHWDASRLPSGVYFLRAQQDDWRRTTRAVLLK